MDKRTLLIIIALLLPLVALAFLSQNGGDRPRPPSTQAAADKPGGMTPAPSAVDAPQPPKRPPANLEEAKARLRQRLADLEKMNEAEWQADRAAKRQRGRTLPPLEPRMPEKQGDPASPPVD